MSNLSKPPAGDTFLLSVHYIFQNFAIAVRYSKIKMRVAIIIFFKDLNITKMVTKEVTDSRTITIIAHLPR